MFAVRVETPCVVSRSGGPNASGKTTFPRCRLSTRPRYRRVGWGFVEANRKSGRIPFRRQGSNLQLAIEARVPDDLRLKTAKPDLDTARYEVAIGFDETQRQFEFKAEKFLLKQTRIKEPLQRPLFPMSPNPPASLLTGNRRNTKTVVNKVPGGNDNFYSETYPQGGKGWAPSFKLGPQKSALGNLPADTKSFPVATWFREYLSTGVQQFVLNSLAIRQPSPRPEFPGPTDPICPGWLAVCAKRTRKGIVTGSHTFGRRLPILRTSKPNVRRTDIATWSTN